VEARPGSISATAHRRMSRADRFSVPCSQSILVPRSLAGCHANTSADRKSTDLPDPHRTPVLLKDLFQAYGFVIFDFLPANPLVDGLAISPLFTNRRGRAERRSTCRRRCCDPCRWYILQCCALMTKVDTGSVGDVRNQQLLLTNPRGHWV
jgi:hypothetical protein